MKFNDEVEDDDDATSNISNSAVANVDDDDYGYGCGDGGDNGFDFKATLPNRIEPTKVKSC